MNEHLYTVGETAVVIVLVKNEEEVLTDPDTLDVVFTPEAGAAVAFSWPATIAKTATGTFRLELPITEAGNWRGSLLATGSVTPAAKPYLIRARAA